MKQMHRITLQAFLDAIAMDCLETATAPDGQRSATRSIRSATLTTRLGPVTLEVPTAVWASLWPEFVSRYAVNESKILLLIGRIFFRGRTSSDTVADLARLLSARPFDAARLAGIAAIIDAELSYYFERELEQKAGQRPAPHDARIFDKLALAHATAGFLPDTWRREA